jgi:acyl-CoA thioesterase-1
MSRALLFSFVALVTIPSFTNGGEEIASMDELKFAVPKENAAAKLVAGKVGQAVEFSFEKDARSTFLTSNLRGTPEWDKAAGFSFWVKGDGSKSCGGLQFIYDDDYAVRYDVAFPISSTEWTKVTVAWEDLVPVLPGEKSIPLGKDGNTPSKLSGLWFGRWWYWGDYPVHSFAIDDIRLEDKIERPAIGASPASPLARVRKKLEAGEPVTIVTMGDSLTDTRHWANQEVNWPKLLEQDLETRYKSKVTIVNPAIGGTQLRQGMVLSPRWLQDVPTPDLVTICYGYNDWDAGMRGPQFEATYVEAVRRIRAATSGKTDVLIITSNPAVERWETMTELAAACRAAAKEASAGLADTERAFHTAGKENRQRLYVDDKVHVSPAGHAIVAEEVVKAIEHK